MRIIIGADFSPTPSNFELFSTGNAAQLCTEDLLCALSGADYRIVNMELPLCDNGKPIKKEGKCMSAPSSCINGYTALGINLVALANNHILDMGASGMLSTEKLLADNGIDYIGVGESTKKMKKFHIITDKSYKIGIYACVENEFTVAGEDTCGANAYNPLNTFDDIRNLKEQCDYVIVLYHGGKEHYRYPSPMLQRVCRKLVESGAGLVVCQHSHCIGCKENYLNGEIIYGQGNFLFDRSESEYRQTGLLVQLDYNDDKTASVGYLPIRRKGCTVTAAHDADLILSDFYKRSEEIKDAEFVRGSYAEFARKYFYGYLMFMSEKESLLFRIINKLSGNRLRQHKLRRNYTDEKLLKILNGYRCEAHHELIVQGILNELNTRQINQR